MRPIGSSVSPGMFASRGCVSWLTRSAPSKLAGTEIQLDLAAGAVAQASLFGGYAGGRGGRGRASRCASPRARYQSDARHIGNAAGRSGTEITTAILTVY